MPRVAIIVPDQNAQPYRFKLDREKVSLGRGKDNDIIVDDPSVSGLHCTMERIAGGYILRDRKSTNGISLDGNDMEIIDLRNGDDVKVGDVIFEYTLGEEELEELDEEDFEPHEKKKSTAVKAAPRKAKSTLPAQAAQAASPSRYSPPAPVLASNTGGTGMIGFGATVLGILALVAGLNNGYVSKQEKNGRSGDFSLFGDIKNGKPAIERNADGE